MDWIKEILEKHINEEGKIDLTKAMDEVKEEFPKQAVPKEVFNNKLEDLKVANKLVDDLKKDNQDIEELQTKITDYETKVENLEQERLKERKNFILKEKLRDSGALDVDYMIYKLGEVETDEEGNIIELDNKIKSLMEENKDHFKVAEEALEGDKKDDKGFKVLDNELKDGNDPDPIAQAIREVEEAMGVVTE